MSSSDGAVPKNCVILGCSTSWGCGFDCVGVSVAVVKAKFDLIIRGRGDRINH